MKKSMDAQKERYCTQDPFIIHFWGANLLLCYFVSGFTRIFSSNLSPAEEAADFVRKNASAHRPDISAFLRRCREGRSKGWTFKNDWTGIIYNDVCNERDDDHYGMEEGWV